jgi:hypothetical protein
MRLSQLLTEDGEIIVSADAMVIIREARERRDAGVSMKRLAAWLREKHGVVMSQKGIHRMLRLIFVVEA